MSLRLSWLRRPDYRKSRTFAASLVDKRAKREGSALYREGSALYYETQDVRLFAAVQRDTHLSPSAKDLDSNRLP